MANNNKPLEKVLSKQENKQTERAFKKTRSELPNGSQKDNEATSFVGQYSMLCVSKIAVGIACGV